jgi:hypothetical protein
MKKEDAAGKGQAVDGRNAMMATGLALELRRRGLLIEPPNLSCART